MNKHVIIMGNGGHASVLTEILLSFDRKIIGFTAPGYQHNSYSLNYLGKDDIIEKYHPDEVELVLAIGTTGISKVRENIFNLYKERGYTFTNVIHPTAIVSPTVKLGEGVQIMAGVIIQSRAEISDNCIINTGAVVDHNCIIRAHVHVAPGCTLSGGVEIHTGCHIGTGATIIQNIKIGQDSLVGAGAVVIKNIGQNKKVVGVPAKEV